MRRRGTSEIAPACDLSLYGAMIGRARRSGGAIPMWRKICSTLRRKSASNSGAFSVVNSSPYHQNQSLARARIVLPRVLAIERHRHRGILVRGGEAREQVLGGVGRVALAVPEADAVAQVAIAKEYRDVAAHPGRMVQGLGRGLLQLAAL